MALVARIAVTLVVLMFVSAETSAREPVTVELETTVLDKFIWRGAPWTDDPVFWPQATIRHGGSRAYLFFNFDLTDINGDRYRCNEFDFIVDHTFRLGGFGIAPGVLHFSSPTDFFDPSTKITLALTADAPLRPSLNFRFDAKGIKGSYLIGKTYAEIPLGFREAVLETAFWLSGGSAKYYGVDKGIVVTDTLLRLSVPAYIGGGWTLRPGLELTALVDPDIRDAYSGENQAAVWYLSLSRTFGL